MKLHERLHKEIFNHLKFSQYIGHIDGKGLLAGIELVEDKKTKKPFDRKKMIAEKIVAKALENGLNLWPNIGHIDGVNGDLILLAPPFTITDSEMDVLFDRLQQTFLEVFKTET